MKLTFPTGTTSQTVRMWVQDSSQTDGRGLTGLAYNTSGLTCYYAREGATGSTAVTLANGTLGTWSSGGFKELDATNMPGWYEIGLPNAVLAAGAGYVDVHLRGAANMVPVPIEIQLASWVADPVDVPAAILGATASSYNSAGTIGAAINTAATGSSLTASDVAVAVVDQTYTGHTTANTVGAALSNAVTNLDATVSSRATVSGVWANATRTTTGGTIDTNGDKTGYALSNAGIDAILTRAMTEAYSTDGGSLTLAQALYELVQYQQEKAISGTTFLVKKRNGSTTALTLSLNDATTPTTVTRSS